MKNQTLILYASTVRSRAERVIWTLNELELDYELIRLDPFTSLSSPSDLDSLLK